MISTLIEFFSLPFLRQAALAGSVAGGLLGYLGIFVLLRRIVFLGAALPQFAAAGAAVGLLLGVWPLPGALLGTFAGVGIVAFLGSNERIPEDGVIGLVYAFASTGAILLLSAAARGQSHLLNVLSGDILGTTTWDVGVLLAGAVLIVILHWGCWKEFLLTSFDPSGAQALGYSLLVWNLLLYGTLAGSVALSLQLTGAVVTFAFLTGPAATGLLLFRRFSRIVPTSVLVGTLAGFLGLVVSFHYDLSGGPTVAACALLPVLPASVWYFLRNGSLR